MTMPSQLVICTNLLPIGTYLCVLGLLHCLRRPWITTGTRDYVALALALSGLIITGPIDYVLHSRMLPDFLIHSHRIGFAVYALLAAALMPRTYEKLVIYNCQSSSIVEAMRTILDQSNERYQEVAGGWILAERGVSIELDSITALRNVTLHFHGMRDRALFQHTQSQLAQLLAARSTGWSILGVTLGTAGALVLAFPVWLVACDPQTAVAALRQAFEAW